MTLNLHGHRSLHPLRLLAPPPVELLRVQRGSPVRRLGPRLGHQHGLAHEAVYHQIVVPHLWEERSLKFLPIAFRRTHPHLHFDGLVGVLPVEDGCRVPGGALVVRHDLAAHSLALAFYYAVGIAL